MHKQSRFPQLSRVAITLGIFPAPHSFQKDFFSDEKEDLANSTKDIDVRLLASLPKGESAVFPFPQACKCSFFTLLSSGLCNRACLSLQIHAEIYLFFYKRSHVGQ